MGTASEEKPTKAGNGSYLELEVEVIDGPCKGRKLNGTDFSNPMRQRGGARATLLCVSFADASGY